MTKCLLISIILLLPIISGCSKSERIAAPVIPAQQDVYWAPAGLDSAMVVSVYRTPGNKIFAGTNYGLFISFDSTASWQLVDQEISSSLVTCFAQYPGNIIIAGTSGSGVFISSNQGVHWTQIGLQGIYVSAIAVHSDGRIFAATRGEGIFITDSADDSWASSNSGFDFPVFSSLLITKNNKIFAGGTGAYRSDDGGLTWQLKNKGLGNWSVQSLIIDSAGYIDAGTDNGGFFKTNDYGENWTKSNNGLTNTEILSLTVNSEGHIFAGTWRGGIFRSLDNGINWTNADSGLVIKMVNTLTCYNDIIYAGTFMGLFRTTQITTFH